MNQISKGIIMELEVGKNYEIKAEGGFGATIINGRQKISRTDGHVFAAEGHKGHFTISQYTFKPLPNFGDEVWLYTENGRRIMPKGKYYYLGESNGSFWLAIAVNGGSFEELKTGNTGNFAKEYYTSISFPESKPEIIHIENKKYKLADVLERIKELPEMDWE